MLHNYNIYSIKIGTISKKNNYDGLLPDMADLAAIAKQNNPNAATPVQNAQNTNSQRTNTQNNAKTQVNTTPQPAKIQSHPSPVKISDINDYPPVYVDPWIVGMFSYDCYITDESVIIDVEFLDDNTHHNI